MDEIIKTKVVIDWDTTSQDAVVMHMKFGTWSNPQLRLSEPDVDKAIEAMTAWKESVNGRR